MKKISIILVIIWMILIFIFSNMNGTLSSMQSDGIVTEIANIFNYSGNLDILSIIVRKLAHFTEYLVLGILVLNACKYNNVKDMLKLSILICILYALGDEIHQLFIRGRSGEILDVLIDTLGGFTSSFIYTIFKVRRKLNE